MCEEGKLKIKYGNIFYQKSSGVSYSFSTNNEYTSISRMKLNLVFPLVSETFLQVILSY